MFEYRGCVTISETALEICALCSSQREQEKHYLDVVQHMNSNKMRERTVPRNSRMAAFASSRQLSKSMLEREW